LRDSQADGTRASLLYVFGFQLNPQVPDTTADVLVRYLKAYLALEDWLVAVTDVYLPRRLSPFVDSFPGDYKGLVLDPAYAPSLSALIDDYLEYNPTRNRGLDLLPVFALVEPGMVRERVDAPEDVRPRPTFHYRLPNCLVDEPAWSFALEWNRWVEVERLAEDPLRLLSVSRDVLSLSSSLGPDEWIERGRAWGLVAP
jgi:hypothetical protein